MTALQQLINCIPTAEEIKQYIFEYQADTQMLEQWLWERIYKNKNWIELEKQQIIDAYKQGSDDCIVYSNTDLSMAEQYYNETFNNNK